MRARRHVRHVQLCLFCGVRGDVDLCPRDADGDTANDGVCGDVDSCPADTENDADGDGTCGGGDCATAVVSYPYDRMIMPITTPCAATRIPAWFLKYLVDLRPPRYGWWREPPEVHLATSMACAATSTCAPRERRRRRPSGDDAVCDDDDDDRA